MNICRNNQVEVLIEYSFKEVPVFYPSPVETMVHQLDVSDPFTVVSSLSHHVPWVMLIDVQKIVWLDFDTAHYCSAVSYLASVGKTLHWAERLTKLWVWRFYFWSLQWRWKAGISDLKMLLSPVQKCRLKRTVSALLTINRDSCVCVINTNTVNKHVALYLLKHRAPYFEESQKGDSRTISLHLNNTLEFCFSVDFPFTGKHHYL